MQLPDGCAGWLGEGSLFHQRCQPHLHQFNYPTSMVAIRLDQLARLNALPGCSSQRPALARFQRSDFLDPHIADLQQAVTQRVCQQAPDIDISHVWLIGHLRSWGHHFNPVVFYWCCDAQHNFQALVAEITNTPWNERHAYVLLRENATTCENGPQGIRLRWHFPKHFHVSPFNSMNQLYDWEFDMQKDRARIQMRVFQLSQGQEQTPKKIHFQSALTLRWQPLTAAAARRMHWRHPAQCMQVVARIYWQALRLWLKRTPFYSHPASTP